MTQIELENKIKKAQEAYYTGNEIISDSEFDKLWDELAINYPESELLKEIGSDLTNKSVKVKHFINMGSQSKFNTEEGLRQWIKNENIKFPVFTQFKLDGSSIELQYENGKFVRAVTRGNGIYGEDVTRAFNKGVKCVPLTLNDTSLTGAVRGELVMLNTIFNTKYSKDFKNPRNLVAGMIKNEKITDFSDLNIICYDAKFKEFEFSTESDKINFLVNNGFIVVTGTLLNSIEEILNFRNRIAFEMKKPYFAVNIDGLVLKQNICDKNDLIETRPKKQHAFKFEDNPEETFVRDIKWSVSGCALTPVAIMDPVEIEGTTVTRASLANPRIIKELGLKLNDKVQITKRGMIIPKIEKVVQHMPDSVDINYPKTCPICMSEVVITDSEIKCSNSECPGKKRHQLEKWLNVLDVKGFGDSLVDFIFKDANIDNIADLYNEDKVSYVKENYYSKVNADKAFKDLLAKSKNISLAQFIAGYDIEGIGIEITQSLVDAGYDTFEKIVEFVKSDCSYEEKIDKLCNINGWSDTRACTFLEGIKTNLNDMLYVINEGFVTIKPEIKTTSVDSPLSGKKVCVTGKLEKFTRKEIEQFIEENGMISQSGVNKETDYLVTNDPNSGSSKNKNAQKFNIPIISEIEFINLVNGE